MKSPRKVSITHLPEANPGLFNFCLYASTPLEGPIQDSQWPASQLPPAVRCLLSIPPFILRVVLAIFSARRFEFLVLLILRFTLLLGILLEKVPRLINCVHVCLAVKRYPEEWQLVGALYWKLRYPALSVLGPLGDGKSSVGWLYRLVNRLISTDSWKNNGAFVMEPLCTNGQMQHVDNGCKVDILKD